MRRILYIYDCDCVPLFENQFGTYQAYENLVDMWGAKSSPSSSDTVSHRVFQSVFQQLLLRIQAQLLLQPQVRHSLRTSRGRTRSLTILQKQVSLMSVFYLVQTFRHHSSKQIQPISRHQKNENKKNLQCIFLGSNNLFNIEMYFPGALCYWLL